MGALLWLFLLAVVASVVVLLVSLRAYTRQANNKLIEHDYQCVVRWLKEPDPDADEVWCGTFGAGTPREGP